MELERPRPHHAEEADSRVGFENRKRVDEEDARRQAEAQKLAAEKNEADIQAGRAKRMDLAAKSALKTPAYKTIEDLQADKQRAGEEKIARLKSEIVALEAKKTEILEKHGKKIVSFLRRSPDTSLIDRDIENRKEQIAKLEITS